MKNKKREYNPELDGYYLVDIFWAIGTQINEKGKKEIVVIPYVYNSDKTKIKVLEDQQVYAVKYSRFCLEGSEVLEKEYKIQDVKIISSSTAFDAYLKYTSIFLMSLQEFNLLINPKHFEREHNFVGEDEYILKTIFSVENILKYKDKIKKAIIKQALDNDKIEKSTPKEISREF